MLAAVRANLYISQTVNCRNDTMFTLCFTGTTWTQEIIWQIYHDGETDSRILSERFPFIEAVVLPHHPHHTTNPKEMLATFASMPSPRLLKTHVHLPYSLAPKGKDESTKPRYICVMRNPKDAVVSLYHHYIAWKVFAYNKPWDHFFNLFMKNEGRKAAIAPSNKVPNGWRHNFFKKTKIVLSVFKIHKQKLCSLLHLHIRLQKVHISWRNGRPSKNIK